MRVSVTSSTRRVDLALPAAVPVADLVPELARCVGLLDAVTAHGGYRLVTQEGRVLAVESGLAIQGVRDGGIITVAAGIDDEPARRYDDVVEAMGDVVERDLEPWDPAAGHPTGLWVAALFLVVGAASLLVQHGAGTAVVAVAMAVLLVVCAVALSHTRGETETQAAVAVALLGCVYAAVAGLMLRGGSPFFGTPVAAAGGGTLASGLVAGLGLARGRALLLPPVVVGAVFLATGLLTKESTVDPAVVLTAALGLVAIGGSFLPWLALGATGTRVDQLSSTADVTQGFDPVDPDRVGADARVAHEILVAMSATVGVLLVLVSPLAVSLGVAGTLVSVLACLVVMLRTRYHRTRAEVLVGLWSGVSGLLSAALSVLWLHPGWRPGAAVALAASGAVLLALTLVPLGRSVRRGRLGDVAESASLLALMPALVVATGVFSSINR